MTDFTFTKHALDMLEERGISEDWVWRTINESDEKFTSEDGNLISPKQLQKEKTVFYT